MELGRHQRPSMGAKPTPDTSSIKVDTMDGSTQQDLYGIRGLSRGPMNHFVGPFTRHIVWACMWAAVERLIAVRCDERTFHGTCTCHETHGFLRDSTGSIYGMSCTLFRHVLEEVLASISKRYLSCLDITPGFLPVRYMSFGSKWCCDPTILWSGIHQKMVHAHQSDTLQTLAYLQYWKGSVHTT